MSQGVPSGSCAYPGMTPTSVHPARRDAIAGQPQFVITETPGYVGRAVAQLASDSEVRRWSGQSLSSGQLAKVRGFTDLDGSQPDARRYLREVQDAGNPADATGCR